jgi:hypothetical protein
MVAPFQAWQDYISAIAVRLVRDYGADGIFLDSWAWRLNLPVSNAAGSYVLYSPLQFTQGVEKLTEKVRDAVRAVKQDAIVMGETTSGPMGHHWDGGLSADFTFPDSVRANRDRILASPARYGIPEVNYISNGGNLNELHQIYAAGYGLALCCNGPVNPAGQNFIQSNADHIRNLVKIRQGYKDALIYGRQSYQPAADREGVSAYFYHGTAHDIITVVNTTDKDANVVLLLNAAEADSKWNDLLTVQTAAAVGQKLKVNVAAQGLLVLLRQPGP